MPEEKLTSFGNPMSAPLTEAQRAWADSVFREVAAKLGVPQPQRASQTKVDDSQHEPSESLSLSDHLPKQLTEVSEISAGVRPLGYH